MQYAGYNNVGSDGLVLYAVSKMIPSQQGHTVPSTADILLD